MLWQKQAGSGNIEFNFNFNTDLELLPFWTHPENISPDLSEVKFLGNLETDRYLVIMLE